ncbi:MAG TPA: hypothetical protein VD978_24360 [Azospirillum sp.]|nr:hypothetical protein [Azospirillum sp.]
MYWDGGLFDHMPLRALLDSLSADERGDPLEERMRTGWQAADAHLRRFSLRHFICDKNALTYCRLFMLSHTIPGWYAKQ